LKFNEGIKLIEDKRIIQDIIKKFIFPYFLTDQETPLYKKINTITLAYYINEFLYSLRTKGPLSYGDLNIIKEKENFRDFGTAVWIPKIMRQLRLDTNKRKNMKRFENQLTYITIKSIRKDPIKQEILANIKAD